MVHVLSRVPISIGIAVVEHEGCYLVGRRGPDGPLPGLDEFPGGKCESGETPRDCAVRECFEEAGLAVEPVELVLNVPFDYPQISVDLHFWLCRLAKHVAAEHVRESHRWVEVDKLCELTFPDGNAPVIKRLLERRR